MRKSIKNYTTSVSVTRTINEIQELLVSKNAEKIMIDYKDGEPISLMFMIRTDTAEIPIQLPARTENVAQIFYQNKNSSKNRYYKKDLSTTEQEQAKRTAWRNLKDWIDAQLALIETDMVKFEEVFLPYIIMQNNKTAFENFKNNQLQIGEGEQHV